MRKVSLLKLGMEIEKRKPHKITFSSSDCSRKAIGAISEMSITFNSVLVSNRLNMVLLINEQSEMRISGITSVYIISEDDVAGIVFEIHCKCDDIEPQTFRFIAV